MYGLVPYAGEADPNSVVGFTWKGMEFTPDSPCLIFGDWYCTMKDYELWKAHALAWIGKVKPVDRWEYQRLVDRYAKLVALNDSTTKARVSAIRALVSMATVARMTVLEKHGGTVTDIRNDWGDAGSIGWPIAEDVWFEIEKALGIVKAKIEKHMQQRWTLWLLGGGALLFLYMGGLRGRR